MRAVAWSGLLVGVAAGLVLVALAVGVVRLLDVTWADVAAGALVAGIVLAGLVLAVALWVPRPGCTCGCCEDQR